MQDTGILEVTKQCSSTRTGLVHPRVTVHILMMDVLQGGGQHVLLHGDPEIVFGTKHSSELGE